MARCLAAALLLSPNRKYETHDASRKGILGDELFPSRSIDFKYLRRGRPAFVAASVRLPHRSRYNSVRTLYAGLLLTRASSWLLVLRLADARSSQQRYFYSN